MAIMYDAFFRHADFEEGGRGYYIDPERDYLSAIPRGQIDLYRDKYDVELTQNPNWN